MKKIYCPPPSHHQSIERLHQHFAQLDHSLSIDTVYLSNLACFSLIWNEAKYFIFSWNIFRHLFQTFFHLSSVILQNHEQEQKLIPVIAKTVLNFLCVIFLLFTFNILTNAQDWKNHQRSLKQSLILMSLFEGFKLLLNLKSPLVDTLGLILFFMHFHHGVSNQLQRCFNTLPPQVKIMRFEFLLFHFSMECIGKKIQDKFLHSFFINARSKRFIYEYDASYHLAHLSSIHFINLIDSILTLAKYARLDLTGNDLFKHLTHQQRDRFLNLIASKRHQVILNQNGESDLQRSFLPLLSMIKQKKLSHYLVINIMEYLIEPQEKELIHYCSADAKAYLEVLKSIFNENLLKKEDFQEEQPQQEQPEEEQPQEEQPQEEQPQEEQPQEEQPQEEQHIEEERQVERLEKHIIKCFFFIFGNTPILELNHHTRFLPPFEPNWLKTPNFIRFFKEKDKEGFDEFSTELILNKLLNEHPIAQKYLS